MPAFAFFTSFTTSKVKVILPLSWSEYDFFQLARVFLNSIINLVIQWCHFPVAAEWGASMKWPAAPGWPSVSAYIAPEKKEHLLALDSVMGKNKVPMFMVDIFLFAQSEVSLRNYRGAQKGSHTNVILWKFGWRIVDHLGFICELIYLPAALRSLGWFADLGGPYSLQPTEDRDNAMKRQLVRWFALGLAEIKNILKSYTMKVNTM